MKRTSEASAPTVTVDHSSAVDSPAQSRTLAVASKIDDTASEVIQWGNGAAVGEPVTVWEGEGEQPPETPKAKPPVAKPAKVKTDAETAEEPTIVEDDETPAATTRPKIDPERRKQILESLDREKNRVTIESRVAEEQKRAEKAEAALAEFEKSPLGKKLATIAKQHGMSMDDLKDKLLIGADDVLDKEPAAPAAPAKDPEVAGLLKWKADREASEAAAHQASAIQGIREALTDTDLPLIEAFDAYDRVMVIGHSAWVAEGKKGSPFDYVPDAAAIVEEQLKTEKPAAARRLYAAAADGEAVETPPAAAAAPPRAARPAMGRRAVARPGTKPPALPDDPYERDQAILKRYGWTR